ncbi:MAG: hypothetical protein PF961_11765 [Planctomycetota bacterium]|nr:hypothetical protein [Planctomycetota bacterium]
MRQLKSPNFWIGIACLLAVIGFSLLMIGWIRDDQLFREIGFWFLGPLLIGGVGIVVIVIPILIMANRKRPPK